MSELALTERQLSIVWMAIGAARVLGCSCHTCELIRELARLVRDAAR